MDRLQVVRLAENCSCLRSRVVSPRSGRALHPDRQAVSSGFASTLMVGGVTAFAGADEMPKVTLAVLAESMRAVLLSLHAGQEKVLVNGDEASQDIETK